MFTRRWRWFAFLLALPALLGLPGRAASAEDAEPEARDRLAAQILEVAQVSMRAKESEARLLEAAGRPAEALAALRSIQAIYERALGLVAQVRAGVAVGRGAVPPVVRMRPLPGEGQPPSWPSPGASRPLAPPSIARLPSPADPVPAAVRFLLGAQRQPSSAEDPSGAPVGAFLPDPAPPDADPGYWRDGGWLPTTSFAVLALLDAVHDGDPALEAVRRAASALAAAVGADGRMGATPQDQALGAWALAAALGRFGETAWRAPLQRALAYPWGELLRDQRLGPEATVVVLWRVAALREAALIEGVLPESLDLERLGREIIDTWPTTPVPPANPAGAYARDLLRLAVDLPMEGEAQGSSGAPVDRFAPLGWWRRETEAPHDPLALLLGTVLVRERFGTDDPREAPTWWNRVLVPAVAKQRSDGPLAGSWDPREPRGVVAGRVWCTAVTLLAWKAWDAPLRTSDPR